MTQQFTADLTLNLITDVLNTPRSVTFPALTPDYVSDRLIAYDMVFNAWIKNVALNAPMGHAVFNHGLDGRVCHENNGTVVFDPIDLNPWCHPAYDGLSDCSDF